jgi:hypothetical protein
MSYRIGKNFWLSNKRLAQLALECETHLQNLREKKYTKIEAAYTELREIREDWFSEMTEDEFYVKFIKPAEEQKDDYLKEDLDDLVDALEVVYFTTKHIKRLDYKLIITGRAYGKALCGERVSASDMEPTLKLAKNRGTLYKKAS